jgi:hypothetical protein
MGTDWKTALHELTRKPPGERAKSAVLDCMRGTDTDRAAALIIGSLVESSLAAAIAHVGLHNRRQITTFANRIRSANALNLIGAATLKNLEVIREVRNTFAHAMSAIEFETPEVTIACNQLVISANHTGFVKEETKRHARFQYGYASQTIFLASLNFAFTRSWLDPRRTPPSTPILP